MYFKQSKWDEPLIFELGSEGRRGFIPPKIENEIINEVGDVLSLIPESVKRKELPQLPQLSEVEVMRHFIKLSQMNYCVDLGPYPLGSCTMKYNLRISERLVKHEGLAWVHPYQDEETVQGLLEIMYKLGKWLAKITGMYEFCLQPSAGAHGELLGALIIRAYHKLNGELGKRKEMIVPDSAHGTNPASAAMAGFKVVVVPSGEDGCIDVEALKSAVSEKTAGLMLTNPNTLGLFERRIIEVADIIHEVGGLLYYDGANLNAIIGRVRPGDMGFDIVHLNLHKTFGTPHGGGGPGSGPVGVVEELEKFLPVPRIAYDGKRYYLDYNKPYSIGKIKSFYGNVAVLVKAYVYILSMGAEGLKEASEIAVLNSTNFTITDLSLNTIEKQTETIDWQYEEDARKGFKHFMLKEIFEQPAAVENALRGRTIEGEGVSKLGGLQPVAPNLDKINRLTFLSCGTSYYAGIYGKYVFRRLTGLNVDVEYASEFRYMDLKLSERDCVLAVSQSGETADTLAALKEAKRKGALTLGLVNVVGSTISKETDAGVYNHAGPEIGVASTKIFTSQCVILTLMALLIGRNHHLSVNEGIHIIRGLKALPEQIRSILKQSEYIRKLAGKYVNSKGFYFIGRHFNYPIAREGALKLKEISYIHAEGYPAGEMKHGAISLIDKEFPTIALATRDFSYEKMVSNIQEIKARKGPVLSVVSEGDRYLPELVDDIITVPDTLDILQPILNVITLQLFAYHIADIKGREIDKPRNLAKSVTVE